MGGFLGSGKTTLLHTCAAMENQVGAAVGLITNDQAAQLVDTIYLKKDTSAVKEVSGSCFCCNFNGFAQSIESLQKENHVEIIFAEPVGSCTDLSATILQPIKKYFQETIDLAPLSVLVDPIRLQNVLSGSAEGIHPSAAYIIEKQLEEADIIVLTKKDTLTDAECDSLLQKTSEKYPGKTVLACSAITKDGVSKWIDIVQKQKNPGATIADVNYDIYAEGEACLGWLNTTITLKGTDFIDWNAFLKTLLTKVQKTLQHGGHAIGHIKAMIVSSDGTQVLGNITGTDSKISIRGNASPGNQAVLTFNARAEIEKDDLTSLTEEKIMKTAEQFHVNAVVSEMNCLIPGRPDPTYRFSEIVS